MEVQQSLRHKSLSLCLTECQKHCSLMERQAAQRQRAFPYEHSLSQSKPPVCATSAALGKQAFPAASKLNPAESPAFARDHAAPVGNDDRRPKDGCRVSFPPWQIYRTYCRLHLTLFCRLPTVAEEMERQRTIAMMCSTAGSSELAELSRII